MPAVYSIGLIVAGVVSLNLAGAHLMTNPRGSDSGLTGPRFGRGVLPGTASAFVGSGARRKLAAVGQFPVKRMQAHREMQFQSPI
jgi:hypothetical protein